MYVRVYVQARAWVCVRACVRACVCVSVCEYVRVRVRVQDEEGLTLELGPIKTLPIYEVTVDADVSPGGSFGMA